MDPPARHAVARDRRAPSEGSALDALDEVARKVVVGSGLDPATTMGPINTRPQFARVNELIESARQDGAVFATGGQGIDSPGYFVDPTIVTGIERGIVRIDM